MADPAPLTAEELAVHVGWSPRGLNGLEVQRLERILATARAAQARAEAAEARLAALKAGGWVSVRERLPEPEVDVAIYPFKGEVRAGFLSRSHSWYAGDYDLPALQVTHWHDLPTPPAPTADPQPEDAAP